MLIFITNQLQFIYQEQINVSETISQICEIALKLKIMFKKNPEKTQIN